MREGGIRTPREYLEAHRSPVHRAALQLETSLDACRAAETARIAQRSLEEAERVRDASLLDLLVARGLALECWGAVYMPNDMHAGTGTYLASRALAEKHVDEMNDHAPQGGYRVARVLVLRPGAPFSVAPTQEPA